MQIKQQFPDASEVALCEELESVIALIQAHAKTATPVPTLAITKLVAGLSYVEWESIVEKHTLHNWLALPLDTSSAEATEAVISLQNRLVFQRDHDALTGIKNRGCFDKAIAHEFDRACRTHSELSLVIIDLDDFKKVNDTFGHATGDKVLQKLASVLSESVASFDLVARIGGEEFAILLPATSCWMAMQQSTAMLEKFRQEVFTSSSCSFSVTFSAGIASLSLLDPPPSIEALFTSADEALYSVKRSGKNAVAVAKTCRLKRDHDTLVHTQEKQFLFSSDDVE